MTASIRVGADIGGTFTDLVFLDGAGDLQVVDGKVSLRAAGEIYGVVIDPERLRIDEAETAKLRETMRRKAPAQPPLYRR